MSTAILFLLMCQSGLAHSNAPLRARTPQMAIPAPALPDPADESPEAEAAYQERQLVQHLNGLLQALNDFADTYKAGFVDVKKLKAVRKALHDLEKSEWFKPQRTAPGAAPDTHKLRLPGPLAYTIGRRSHRERRCLRDSEGIKSLGTRSGH